MLKNALLFICWTFQLLFGWSQVQQEVLQAPVTVERIDVQVKNQRERIVYQQPEKMSQILYCLRTMEFRGFAEEKPEQVKGGACNFVVYLTDGTRKAYQLRGGNYFTRDGSRWQKIPPEQMQELYTLLLQVSGDSLVFVQSESLQFGQSGQSGRTFICSS